MIVFSCPECAKELKVKPELAGKRGKCPHCRASIAVPDSADGQKAFVGAGKKDEAKTLATSKKAGVGEAKTLAPAARPSVSKPARGKAGSDAKTLLPGKAGRKTGDTVTEDGAAVGDASTELTDFLEPAQGLDELGRLGKYRVLKVLGAGGMGVVYEAEDSVLKRPVALKALLPGMSASKAARDRFLREAQSSAMLQHDNVVTIYDVNEANNVPFLAMQLLQGEALDARLTRETALPLDEVLRIGRETAEGLAAAHERNMIHRDIKPANLFLEAPKGRVKILDFGLARPAGESKLTQLGAVVGTPGYLSPEQANGKPVDARGDLFSLGCVLYRLTTGELPFKGEDMLSLLTSLATTEPTAPSQLNIEVPPALSGLIMRLLSKDPAARPASAGEVADTLGAIADGSTPAAPMMALIEDEAEEAAVPLPADAVVDAPRIVIHKEDSRSTTRPALLPARGRDDERDLVARKSNKDDFPWWIVWTACGITAFLVIAGVSIWLIMRPKDEGPRSDTDDEPVARRKTPEQERLEKAQKEQERIAQETRERLERERLERERLERERLERERAEEAKRIKPFRSKNVENGQSHWIAFHPDGKRFVTCVPQGGKNLGFWDLDSEEPEIAPVPNGVSQAPCYSSDGKKLLIGSGQNAIVVGMEAKPYNAIAILTPQDNKPRPNVPLPTPENLIGIGWSATDQPLAVYTGHLRGARFVALFEVDTKKLHGVWIPYDNSFVKDAIPTPDGQSVILVDDKVTGVFDTATGAPKASFKSLDGKPKKFALSPDGKRFLTSYNNNVVKLWDVQTGAAIRSFTFGKSAIDSVGFSPDGKLGVCGSSPGESRLYIWDLEKGDLRAEFAGQGWMNSAAVSADMKSAIGGCSGGQNNLFWYRIPPKE
jgi:serine/threonine protein kinase